MLIFAALAVGIQLLSLWKRNVVSQVPFNFIFVVLYAFSYSFVVMYFGSLYIARLVLVLATFSAAAIFGLGLYVIIKVK